MTIPNTTYQNSYTSSGGVTYAYTFKLLDSADIEVVVVDTNGVETTKTLNVDFTVTGVGNPTGGNVVFGVAPTSGYGVYLTRLPASTQESAFPEGGTFPAATMENALDYLTMLAHGDADDDGAFQGFLLGLHGILGRGPFRRLRAEGGLCRAADVTGTGAAAAAWFVRPVAGAASDAVRLTGDQVARTGERHAAANRTASAAPGPHRAARAAARTQRLRIAGAAGRTATATAAGTAGDGHAHAAHAAAHAAASRSIRPPPDPATAAGAEAGQTEAGAADTGER